MQLSIGTDEILSQALDLVKTTKDKGNILTKNTAVTV